MHPCVETAMACSLQVKPTNKFLVKAGLRSTGRRNRYEEINANLQQPKNRLCIYNIDVSKNGKL